MSRSPASPVAVTVPRFAVLSPHAARWIVAQLGRAGVNGGAVRADAYFRRQAGHHAWADELEQGWQQLIAAVRSGEPSAEREGSASGAPPAATSDCGSAEVPSDDAATGLHQVVTTSAAAEALGLSERRVRQLLEAGHLRGRKAGRSWLVEHPLEDLKSLRR